MTPPNNNIVTLPTNLRCYGGIRVLIVEDAIGTRVNIAAKLKARLRLGSRIVLVQLESVESAARRRRISRAFITASGRSAEGVVVDPGCPAPTPVLSWIGGYMSGPWKGARGDIKRVHAPIAVGITEITKSGLTSETTLATRMFETVFFPHETAEAVPTIE